MRVEVGGPAVEEEADGDEEAAGEHEGDAEFGAAGVGVVGLEGFVDLITELKISFSYQCE